MALAVLNLASQARFSPGQVVMTAGVDELVDRAGSAPRRTCAAIFGDWGDLDDDDRRQNDAAPEVRRGSSVLVLPGHARPEALDHHRMGSQRHHTAAAQRILIRIQRPRAASFFPPRACHRPWGVCMPIALEHHHVPRSRNRSRNRCAGRPARALLHPSLSLQDFVSGSATSCSIRSTAPILRSHRPGAGASATDPRRAEAAKLFRRKPMWSMPSPSCWSIAANAPRSSMAKMGCGKTTVGIAATAAVLNAEGYRHPGALATHLVYKWRREIQETVAGAKVWVLNGPDTLVKLLKLREQLGVPAGARVLPGPRADADGVPLETCLRSAAHASRRRGACPDCGHVITDLDGEPINPVELEAEESRPQVQPLPCTAVVVDPVPEACRQRPVLDRAQGTEAYSNHREVTAQKLMQKFGDAFLASMLGDNIHEFINLMDGNGELVFSDRQAHRMERAMANMSSASARGGYQPSGVHQRQPQGTFDLLIADEAHEYKNGGSARARPWGCWQPKARKTLLLTGTDGRLRRRPVPPAVPSLPGG